MTRALGMVSEDLDPLSVNGMALQMVDSIGHATEATWCALMKDRSGMKHALTKFRSSLDTLVKA